jgi:DNA mismatch repair protein MutL
LIAEGDAGVYLVDQHAAHERVLLEQLRLGLRERSEQQLLLEALVLDVPPSAVALVEQAASDLSQLGFALEPFGPRQVLVRGVPGLLVDRQPQRVLQETLVTLATNTHGLVIEQHASWAERLATVLACKSAVRAGDILALAEMEALLKQLSEANLCRTCAHGRPTAILLSHAQLEKEFGRR